MAAQQHVARPPPAPVRPMEGRHPSRCLSRYPSHCPSRHPSRCLSRYPSHHPSRCLSRCLSRYPSHYPSCYPSRCPICPRHLPSDGAGWRRRVQTRIVTMMVTRTVTRIVVMMVTRTMTRTSLSCTPRFESRMYASLNMYERARQHKHARTYARIRARARAHTHTHRLIHPQSRFTQGGARRPEPPRGQPPR